MIFAAGDRLILRRPRDSDLEPLLPGWSDPEMTRYLSPRDDPRGFLTGLIADMLAKAPGETEPGGPWYNFVVERREDGAVAGDLGVGFGVPGERQVELGWRILPAFQRRGYAREAVEALIGWLIEAHQIHRFVGIAASENAASVALLRSLGFRQEGHFRESFLCNGRWLDDSYFALLASEWRGRDG
ncbi:MAG TPA: GNAT family N-acetyltransferase [Allosphingosinicella sp.]|nr:GNAT family N-acetyltransferase [Allosphingosinicella sp.]